MDMGLKEYNISGITCDNCKATITKSLMTIPQVEEIQFNHANQEIIVSFSSRVSLEDLQKVLPDKYKITAKELIKTIFQSSEKTRWQNFKSKVRQLNPLLIILFYLLIASNLMHIQNWNFSDVMLDFMGLFFIVFSFFKFLDLKGFPDSFRIYDPLARYIPFYAKIYPFLETALGLMFLFRFEIFVAMIITLIVLGVTTIGVTKTLLDKNSIRCACLGTVLKLPMTEATFLENVLMISMAIIMIVNYM